MSAIACDVAIVGGGPAGSTLSTLLKKYAPELDVLVLEKSKFPRKHVGESQLPLIGQVLDEMGCWEKVEAAQFPIKIGATYRWGNTDDLWDFEFLAGESFTQGKRPGRYSGQRRKTAFQVERSVYDDILLKHAREMGVDVREETGVRDVRKTGDRIDGLVTDDGTAITAKHYVDASGAAAVLRKAMDVETSAPTRLQNVAFWDYWDDAEWAVTIAKDATRVMVMSLGYGWIWFIPISKTRASVGLVVPAEHYKKMGKRPAELYAEALASEPLISDRLKNARAQGDVQGTKDWSFLSDRMVGENWYLAGEVAGFADPILAAGMTLTHVGARELAYVLTGIERDGLDPDWLKSHYADTQSRRIRQHIRFADYWYSANGHFSDLKEFTREIAQDAGLELDANRAFQWLGTGGFANDDYRVARVATFSLAATKQLTQFLGSGQTDWEVAKYNVFQADLSGAERHEVPIFHEGRIERRTVLERSGKRLPMAGAYAVLAKALGSRTKASEVARLIGELFPDEARRTNAVECLESMVIDGWVKGKRSGSKATFEQTTPDESAVLHRNRDVAPVTSDRK